MQGFRYEYAVSSNEEARLFGLGLFGLSDAER